MDTLDLSGIAGQFEAQSTKEKVRADKFIIHMLNRGTALLFGTIKAQTEHVTTVLGTFEVTLIHEKRVSETIRNLYHLASSINGIDTLPLLNWFVGERIEEEPTVPTIIGRIKLVGNDSNGILCLNKGLGVWGITAE